MPLKFRHLLAIALLSPFAQPTAASAQVHATQVWDQLQTHFEIFTGLEDLELRNYVMGRLGDDETDSWTFSFNTGTAYVITAACDNDCSDVDVFIKNEAGETVVSDTEVDDYPMVTFTPTVSGRYTIDVKMYDCSTSYCYFGFGLFSQ
jgi:hypothetical protein